MNVKRIAMLSTAGAVLAAMIAGATTSGVRRPAPVVIAPNTTAIELRGAELAAEVARLRARLRPTDQPQEPARNLFQFNTQTAGPAAWAPVAPRVGPPIAATPPPPPLSLIGFASEGTTRTAIISGFGDLFFANEGDAIAALYRVSRIGADGVDVTSTADNATFTLKLQQ